MSPAPWCYPEPCWQHQISQQLPNGFCFYFPNRRKSPCSPVLNTQAYYVLYRSPIPALGLHTVVAISSILHGISRGWNNGAAAVLQECKKSKVGPLWTPYFYICSEKPSKQLHAVSALCSTERMWMGWTWQRGSFPNVVLSSYSYFRTGLKFVSLLGGWLPWRQQADGQNERDSLTWFQAPLINSSSDEATALIKSALLWQND